MQQEDNAVPKLGMQDNGETSMENDSIESEISEGASPHQIHEKFIAPELLAKISKQNQNQKFNQSQKLKELEKRQKTVQFHAQSNDSNSKQQFATDLQKFGALESQQTKFFSSGLSRFLSQQMAVELLWEKYILPKEKQLVEALNDHVMNKLRDDSDGESSDAKSSCPHVSNNGSRDRGRSTQTSKQETIKKRFQSKTIGDSFFHFMKLYFESNKSNSHKIVLRRYVDYLTQLHNNNDEALNNHKISAIEYKIFVDYVIDIIEQNVPQLNFPSDPSPKEIAKISANRIILTFLRYHLEKLCLIFLGEIHSWNPTNLRIRRSQVQWVNKQSLLG